jgi:hypothetical protein
MDFFCPSETFDAIDELHTQALILGALDTDECNSRVNSGLFVDDGAVRRITDIAVHHNKQDLLTWAVESVCAALTDASFLVQEAAIHAVAAVVLAEHLSEADAAALSLPWSFTVPA